MDEAEAMNSHGRGGIFLRSISDKFQSHDPDIFLRTVRLLGVVMENSMVIRSVMLHKNFTIKNFQLELRGEVDDALESFPDNDST